MEKPLSHLLLLCLVSLAIPSIAQRGFINYYLDASVSNIEGASGEILLFQASIYPELTQAEDDQQMSTMNATFKGSLSENPGEMVESFTRLELDDLMDSRQILEMLTARIGLSMKELEQKDHRVEIMITIVDWVDEESPLMNIQRVSTFSGNSLAHPASGQAYCVVNASTGDSLTLGDLGSKKIIACAQQSLATSNFRDEQCQEESMKKIWGDQLSCQSPVARVKDGRLFLHTNLRSFGCPEAQARDWMISISMECFKGDKPCVH